MRKVSLPKGEPKGGFTSSACYFPEDALLCEVAHADEEHVETCVVGCDGLVGLHALWGQRESPHRLVVQVGGQSWRIPARALNTAMSEPAVRRVFEHYYHCLHVQIAQTAACNARHNAMQRSARWLLLAHDRVPSGLVRVTHDALASKLGLRRQQISAVLAKLQAIKAIESGRGWLRARDRSKLKAAACECYGIIAEEYARTLGFNECGAGAG